ncbi:MAG: hypothetical protein PHY82_02705 [Lentisphaeria bacterium]|nr:hypothetical protein [Lentisphaeria bacterium]
MGKYSASWKCLFTIVMAVALLCPAFVANAAISSDLEARIVADVEAGKTMQEIIETYADAAGLQDLVIFLLMRYPGLSADIYSGLAAYGAEHNIPSDQIEQLWQFATTEAGVQDPYDPVEATQAKDIYTH